MVEIKAEATGNKAAALEAPSPRTLKSPWHHRPVYSITDSPYKMYRVAWESYGESDFSVHA
jgi:hypothetical protein